MTENVAVSVKPNGVPQELIPSDWAALGATRGYDPRKAHELRLWILGPSGEGKSTFASSIPQTLILDFEDGVRAIPGQRATRIHVPNYDKYRTVVDKLLAEARVGKFTWKRVIVDTVDGWVQLMNINLSNELGIDDVTEMARGSGYSKLKKRCWADIAELEGAGYTWGCVGHITSKNVVNPVTKQESTVVSPLLYDSFASLIQMQADVQCMMWNIVKEEPKMEKMTLPGGQVKMIQKGTTHVSKYYMSISEGGAGQGTTKARGVPCLSGKIEVPIVDGWQEFARVYSDAVEKTRKEYGPKV